MAHDATRPQRLWLIGTPGRDRRRLRVRVRTQSKSIECSFNVVSIVLPQCRFNVVYSADRPSDWTCERTRQSVVCAAQSMDCPQICILRPLYARSMDCARNPWIVTRSTDPWFAQRNPWFAQRNPWIAQIHTLGPT